MSGKNRNVIFLIEIVLEIHFNGILLNLNMCWNCHLRWFFFYLNCPISFDETIFLEKMKHRNTIKCQFIFHFSPLPKEGKKMKCCEFFFLSVKIFYSKTFFQSTQKLFSPSSYFFPFQILISKDLITKKNLF